MIIPRWWIVVPAAAAWPLFLVGLQQDWWGNGVGDGWQASLAAGALAGGLGAAIGVRSRRRGSGGSAHARG
jgi:hypothetical protein